MSHDDAETVVAEWVSALNSKDWARAAVLSEVRVAGPAVDALRSSFKDARHIRVTVPPHRTQPGGRWRFGVAWQADALDRGGGTYRLAHHRDGFRVVVEVVIR